jgi:predicted RNase H-like nuclease (RuvC/YqgF family)
MRKNDWMKVTLVALGLCLSPFASCAQDQSSTQQTGDPVADAARKAREEKQKKDAQKAKKVYTDDDIKPATPDKPEIQNASAAGAAASGTEAPPTGGSQAGTAQKPEDAKNTEKEDPNGEKAWRRRFADQHKKIADTEKEIEVLQRELEKSSVQYYADPTKAMNQQNSRAEINDKTAKIEAKKKDLAQLRQQLDDMEADLRKAGGDPGWAR